MSTAPLNHSLIACSGISATWHCCSRTWLPCEPTRSFLKTSTHCAGADPNQSSRRLPPRPVTRVCWSVPMLSMNEWKVHGSDDDRVLMIVRGHWVATLLQHKFGIQKICTGDGDSIAF